MTPKSYLIRAVFVYILCALFFALAYWKTTNWYRLNWFDLYLLCPLVYVLIAFSVKYIIRKIAARKEVFKTISNYYANLEKSLFNCFCLFWVLFLLVFYFAKELECNLPRFEATTNLGATWEEINKEYNLSQTPQASVDDITVRQKPQWNVYVPENGVGVIQDSIPSRSPEEKETTATLTSFYPNAKRTCLVSSSSSKKYLLIFDGNDILIARLEL